MSNKIINDCPKVERCKHAKDCVNFDCFRGEYVCFESKNKNVYEYRTEANEKAKLKCAKNKKRRR